MSDVNQGQETAPAPSSEAEGQQTGQEKPVQASAETEKPEKEWEFPEKNPGWPAGVYERFKKVNEERKSFAEKLKTFDGKEDLLGVYEQFDNLLEQDPQLLGVITEAIKMIKDQQVGNVPQTQPQYGDQEVRTNSYLERFQRLVSEKKIPEDLKQDYLAETYHELMRINPDPLNNFRVADVDRAFKTVLDREERKFRHRQAAYTKDKNEDNLPASGSRTGASPMPSPKPLLTQNDRAAAMADMLRAGGI